MKIFKKINTISVYDITGLFIGFSIMLFLYTSFSYFDMIELRYKINRFLTLISIILFGIITLVFGVYAIGFSFIKKSNQLENEFLKKYLKNIRNSIFLIIITNIVWNFLLFFLNSEKTNLSISNTLILTLFPIILNFYMIFVFIKSRKEIKNN